MNASRNDATIVVGAGIAGLTTALELAPRRAIVLSRAPLGDGAATAWAQGGIAAAIGSDDSPALHAADTLAAAAGIGDIRVIDLLAREAPHCIERLMEFGTEFDRDANGQLALGREAAHNRRRILHAGGDATGFVVLQALIALARKTPSIELIEDVAAYEVVMSGDRAIGVRAFAHSGPRTFLGAQVVLATGGVGGLYRYTTNPLDACGDGIAMAARIGAELADLEFVQFHPTALDVGRDPMPLATEALRGEGALVIDECGERFLFASDPRGELAPRDIVARGIYRHHAAGHATLLDARAAVGAAFPDRFPTVFEACRQAGIDPRTQVIPIATAAHYHMGGIAVDDWGRSTIPGLFACGEVAATGVHGANRLASNSLLEGLVFASRIGQDIASHESVEPGDVVLAEEDRTGDIPVEAMLALRRAMYDGVGVVRDAAGIQRAIHAIDLLKHAAPRSIAFSNRLLVAHAIATSALQRRESRGGHERSDFPQPVSSFEHRTFVRIANPEAAVGTR